MENGIVIDMGAIEDISKQTNTLYTWSKLLPEWPMHPIDALLRLRLADREESPSQVSKQRERNKYVQTLG
jgi:hypothetical protein